MLQFDVNYVLSHGSLKLNNESEYRLNTKYKTCYAFILFYFLNNSENTF